MEKVQRVEKRVNEHVLSMSNTVGNTNQRQRGEHLSLSLDEGVNDPLGNDLHVGFSASFHGPSISQEVHEIASQNLQNGVGTESNISAEVSFEANDGEIYCNWQHTVENAEEILFDSSLHVSSSESENEQVEESDESTGLALGLATSATKFGVSHSAVKELLCILRPFHSF